jgi:dipeptidyl aminopeptidase/acylaminoacyl peptidase
MVLAGVSDMRRAAFICISALLCCGGDRTAAMPPPTEAFANLPVVSDPELSPDGRFISYIAVVEGLRVVLVGTVATGQSKLVLASDRDRFDVRDCYWAKPERLLCSYFGITAVSGVKFGVTRLVAVNADGGEMKVLLQNRGDLGASQFQDDVIDLLPDDPTDILTTVRPRNENRFAVYRLNVMTGQTRRVTAEAEYALSYVTDGAGNVRLRRRLKDETVIWEHRPPNETRWSLLKQFRPASEPEFGPIGFNEDGTRLYVYQPYADRRAVWSIDPAGVEAPKLTYAHPRVDVSGVIGLGPKRSLVAATYVTDKPHIAFFDDRVKDLLARLNRQLPDTVNSIVSASWDRRILVVYAESDTKAGSYYIYSPGADRLYPFGSPYPDLRDFNLSPMQPVDMAARDGVKIPSYLTLPEGREARALPLVVMPHGGPSARDVWGFDWLAQFFASRGYAVLQPNFRGSDGYGRAWEMGNGIKAWATAVADVADSAKALAAKGVVDANRVCVVGWSFGGYIALMSSIVEAATYKCGVAIAPPSDWDEMVRDSRNFMNADIMREYIGADPAVRERGSPLKRVAEVSLPLLLFHGDDDLNVTVDHSRDMAKALQRAGK